MTKPSLKTVILADMRTFITSALNWYKAGNLYYFADCIYKAEVLNATYYFCYKDFDIVNFIDKQSKELDLDIRGNEALWLSHNLLHISTTEISKHKFKTYSDVSKYLMSELYLKNNKSGNSCVKECLI